MVHTGRKMCGNARRIAKRATAPATRSVPTQVPSPTYEARGTADVAKLTKRERELLDAWDNTGIVGNTVEWNKSTRCTDIRVMARKSGTHVYDGPVAHDIGPIRGRTENPIASTSAREFVRQLHIERRNAR